MSLDAIKQISEVEQQAEEIVNQARAQAREKLLEVQKQTSELRAQLIAQQNRSIQDAVHTAQADGELFIQASVAKAHIDCETLTQTAEGNMPSAISLIVGRVVKI